MIDTEKFRLRHFVEKLVQQGECLVHDDPIDLIDVARCWIAIPTRSGSARSGRKGPSSPATEAREGQRAEDWRRRTDNPASVVCRSTG